MFVCFGSANATILNFDDLESLSGDDNQLFHTYTKDGYTLSADLYSPADGTVYSPEDFLVHTISCCDYQGSAAIEAQGAGTTTTLKRTDGGTFNLNSMDLSSVTLDYWGTPPALEYAFIGTLLGGGTISQTFTVDHGFQTANFTGFTNVTQVQWGRYLLNAPQIDNINVSTVPLPASFWLMGTGLLGLVRAKERNRKTA